MRLSELKAGESGVVLKVLGHGGFRRRIMEMGFVRGQRVEVLLNAPLLDPIDYKIMGYDISLRRSEAEMVVIITQTEADRMLRDEKIESNTVENLLETVVSREHKRINIALVGNPNSGKTSLFNAMSGRHEHVGNYSGVTVDAKRGHRSYKGYEFTVTDLPGTYALSAYTPEELYVRRHLETDMPDVVVNAVVASNLERNLYLTAELIDMNPRMVVALNMYDELEASGASLDHDSLGRMLGVPMVPVVARSGRGIESLLDTVIDVYENRDDRVRHIHINQGAVIEESLKVLGDALNRQRAQLPKMFPPRYFAMRLLEGDKEIEKMLAGCPDFDRWLEIRDREARRITEELEEDVETAFANRKYGFVSGALKETYTPAGQEVQRLTDAIDALVTHRVWGFPIFFLLMGLMFYCTFSLGTYPQEWMTRLVELVGRGAGMLLPDGILKDLIADGIIGGVGSVIVFLPNIMILYLFISFMEDSGYLARAAFIMD
ncbi:MAG: 50S ribosome-binding GTPase, partial [Alistipes sp.]|nr:50S ribosome-binding GTPase [Alistipes sp.]